jgi:hypothetical protein
VGAIGSGQVVAGTVRTTASSGADDEAAVRSSATVAGTAVRPDPLETNVRARPLTDETAGVRRAVAVTAISLAGNGATNRWIDAVVTVTTGRATSTSDRTEGDLAERTAAPAVFRPDAITRVSAVAADFPDATTGTSAEVPGGATGVATGTTGRTGARGAVITGAGSAVATGAGVAA